jgi:hypothetical protein
MKGFHVSPDGSMCDSNIKCFKSIPNCAQCDPDKGYEKCKTCEEGYHLNRDKTECRHSETWCKDESRAGELCKTCDIPKRHSDFRCAECVTGAYKYDNGKKCYGPEACLAIIPECIKCEKRQTYKCAECKNPTLVSDSGMSCYNLADGDPDEGYPYK